MPFKRMFWRTEEEKERWPDAAKADPLLKHALVQELPGILRLALEAYSGAVAHGFTQPTSCLEARRRWRLEADQVQQFMEEMCDKRASGDALISDLFRTYTAWAKDSGIRRTVGKISFGDRLEKLGFTRARDNAARKISGIELNADGRGILAREDTGGRYS